MYTPGTCSAAGDWDSSSSGSNVIVTGEGASHLAIGESHITQGSCLLLSWHSSISFKYPSTFQ